MSRLTWIERNHGWCAGPYEIELAAPQLWVCTRRLRKGGSRVEMTSGSLSALQASIGERHRRRIQVRRSFGYAGVFLASVLVITLAALLEWTLAPLLVLVFSGAGLYAALKTVDCLVSRSWECLHLHYQ